MPATIAPPTPEAPRGETGLARRESGIRPGLNGIPKHVRTRYLLASYGLVLLLGAMILIAATTFGAVLGLTTSTRALLTSLIATVSGALCASFVLNGYLGYALYVVVTQMLWLPMPLPRTDRRSCCMLLGLGESGKTELVKTITNDPQARPGVRTENYELYWHEFRPSPIQPRYHLFFSDYRGQDLGSLVKSFVLMQKRAFAPMAYGHITSLVLVVDLAPGKGQECELNRPDPARVAVHVKQWTHLVLEGVFGMLHERSLGYVCLFINKSDRLKNPAARKEETQAMFGEIETSIRERVRAASAAKGQPIKFEVLVGSALRNDNVITLRNRLIDSSIPADDIHPPLDHILGD